ncbi:MAG: NAD(P)-dependent alcohol dehydrogenase [Acidobacteria bacterium]|nr:NAD(P)-dependent alcohol dehydrogenase [Acidobacteriota bacterium]
MRAWQITDTFSIDSLKLNTAAAEPQPGPGQVTVRVRAVSLNFRDLLVIKGLYTKKLPLPLTICSDAAGEIAAVGAGVTRVKPGDRVCGLFMPAWIAGGCSDGAARSAQGAFAPGVLAEQILLSEEAVTPTSAHLSDAEAATLPCAAVTAWNALMQGGLKAGDTVLVQGTGGVSIFALQLARAAGARVIATTSSDEKAARLKELGAAHVINYKANPEWDEAMRKGGLGPVDQVIEIGGQGTFNRSLKAVRMGGYVALIGNRADAALGDAPNLTTALMKGVRIQGIFVGSREMFEAMNRAIALHAIRPVTDRVFAFEDAADALRYFETGAHFGKVVIAL